MAVVNPPYAIQSRTDHDATGLRIAFGGLQDGAVLGATAPRGGVHPALGNRMAVTGSGSTMQVTVDTGMCYVPNATAWEGVYSCVNSSATTLSVTAANATLFRRDLVVAQILDTEFGDGSSAYQLAVIQGANNASSPAPLPTQPARTLLLAIINVDPAITNLASKVSDQRSFVGGIGPINCLSTARPTTPRSGLEVFETDTSTLRYYDGSGYRYVSDAGWKSWTPATSGFGSGTFTSKAGRYKYVGEKAVAVQVQLQMNTAGTGSAFLTFDLPFPAARTIRQVINGQKEIGATNGPVNALLLASGSGATIDRIRDNSGGNQVGTDAVASAVYCFSGVYELS